MIIEHLKEMLCTGLDPLEMALRNCQESGVELVAIGIGTLVYRLTRSPGVPARRRRLRWLRLVLRGPGRLHATAFVRAAGRMLAPALFS